MSKSRQPLTGLALAVGDVVDGRRALEALQGGLEKANLLQRHLAKWLRVEITTAGGALVLEAVKPTERMRKALAACKAAGGDRKRAGGGRKFAGHAGSMGQSSKRRKRNGSLAGTLTKSA